MHSRSSGQKRYGHEVIRLARLTRTASVKLKHPLGSGLISQSLLRKIVSGERTLTDAAHAKIVAALNQRLEAKLDSMSSPALRAEKERLLVALARVPWMRVDRLRRHARVCPERLLKLASDRAAARTWWAEGRLHLSIRLKTPVPKAEPQCFCRAAQPRQISVLVNRLLRQMNRRGGNPMRSRERR